MKSILPFILILLVVFSVPSLAEEETAAEENAAAVDEVLLSTSQPGRLETRQLVGYLGDRRATFREAAVRRLSQFPERSGKLVVETFLEGNLAAKLAAREILVEWKIDVDTIDPWRSETLTEASRAAILAQLDVMLQKMSAEGEEEEVTAAEEEKEEEEEEKIEEEGTQEGKAVEEKDQGEEAAQETLNETQLADARDSLDRMLRADSEEEATAIRERLYRLGPALLDEVRTRLKNSTSDRDYQRLTTLRYRLASSATLPLRWPDGLERLASTDPKTRQKAAEELIEKMRQGDQSLLVELFANPDSMIREISLRGLQRLGTRDSIQTLGRLLDDPEPNVRAAVLKMAMESPSPGFVRQVVQYLEKETDADLLVHGIRVLKESQDERSARVLIKMLQHESWQVRAEAAETLGAFCDSSYRYGGSFSSEMSSSERDAQQLSVDIYVALLKQLEDPDPFVISRIVGSLDDVDMEVAVEPLVSVIERQPELAEKIIETLAGGETMRVKSMPHLERFAKHEKASIRAAAISGLLDLAPGKSEEVVMAGLEDEASEVRLHVLRRLVEMMANDLSNQTDTLYEKYYANRGSGGFPGDGEIYFSAPVSSEPNKTFSGFLSGIADGVAKVMLKTDTPQPVLVEADNKTDSETDTETVSETASEVPKEVEPQEMPAVLPDTVASEEVPTEKEVAEAETSEKTPPMWEAYQRWIVDYAQGKYRAEWFTKTIPLLEKSLTSDSAEERVLAARALIPLGKVDAPLAALMETVEKTFAKGKNESEPTEKSENKPGVETTASRTAIFEHATKILPWLSTEMRREVYQKLKRYAIDDEQVTMLLSGASIPLDPVLVEDMWTLLVDDPADEKERERSYRDYILPQMIQAAIFPRRESYMPMGMGRPISGLTKAAARKMIEQKIADGNEKQRLLAIWLLAKDDNPKAIQTAEQWLADEAFSVEFRDNLFQVLLLVSPKSDAQSRAVETLKNAAASKSHLKNSLRFLAIGENAVQQGLSISEMVSSYRRESSGGKPIVPELPPGVTLPLVRPFLNDKDPEIAALAGYLVSICGEPAGLPPLLEFWEKQKKEESGIYGHFTKELLQKTVYRAIAYLNDTEKIDILREIYESHDTYELGEFYWTIRIMSGDDIAKFRKEIRDRVGGIEHLQ